jgi:hypothetical protein
MNERIQELWEQAVRGDGPHASVIADFAELIVQECIDIARDEEGHSPFEGPVETKIKQHFGVK